MNIIIINDYAFVNGGASNVALNTTKALAKRNYKVILFSGVGPVDKSLLEMDNIKIICTEQKDILNDDNRIRAAINGIWNHKAARMLDIVLKGLNQNDTIIHIHSISKCLSTSVIKVAKKNNFKMIYHMHDYGIACPNLGFYNYKENKICDKKAMGANCLMTNCDRRSVFHKIWRLLRQWVQVNIGGVPSNVDCIIYISMFSLKKIEKYLKNKTVKYLPNYIVSSKKERAIVENNCNYVFVGRLSPEKNPEIVAKATYDLGVPIIFVGAGECEDSIRSINPQAKITGWQSPIKVKEYLRSARALIFPSNCYEGQPLSVMESLAEGVPVITSDANAAIEQIIDGVNGKLFVSNNIDSLKEILKEFSNCIMVKKMSINAYNSYWYEDYNEDEYIKKLLEIYHGVLSNK